MNKRKVKVLLSVLAVCLILVIALSVIPILQETTVEFTGAVVTADGEILEMTDITYTEDTLNYLFRDRKEDKVRFFISTDNSDWAFSPPQNRTKFGNLYYRYLPDVPYISLSTLVSSNTDPYWSVPGGFAVSLEHGYFIAGVWDSSDEFLIGSTNENIDPAAILNFFSEWIDVNYS